MAGEPDAASAAESYTTPETGKARGVFGAIYPPATKNLPTAISLHPSSLMTDLSPAAQAVLVAAARARPRVTGIEAADVAAAALRAAADQVVPEQRKPIYPNCWKESAWTTNQDNRSQLLAIAAQLDGGTSTSSPH